MTTRALSKKISPHSVLQCLFNVQLFKIDFVKGISISANLSPQNHSNQAKLIPNSNKRESDEKPKRPAKLRYQRRQWIDQFLCLHPGLVSAGLETNGQSVWPE